MARDTDTASAALISHLHGTIDALDAERRSPAAETEGPLAGVAG
jgi:hypothetical protein